MAAFTGFSRQAKGPGLLLIHGFPLDHRIWKDVIDRLPTTIDLFAPDLPGCGGSSLPEIAWTMDEYARHLLQQMDFRGFQKFFVAGHSMGGYILFALLRLAPDRITGGALVSSRALADNEEGRKTRETVAQRAEKEGTEFLATTMPEKAVGNQPPPGVIDTLRTVIREAQPKGVAAAARAMASRRRHAAAGRGHLSHRRLRRPPGQDRPARGERGDGEGHPGRPARLVRTIGPRPDARGTGPGRARPLGARLLNPLKVEKTTSLFSQLACPQ
jgi:pimeloyl-ACP methyl ester carboxylesterase